MRSYKFFYHYNKPASKKAGKPQATIHWKGQCMIVDNIVCKVETYSMVRKRQPVWVIAGEAVEIEVIDNIATIFSDEEWEHYNES